MLQTKAQLKEFLKAEEAIYGKKWYYFLPIYLTEQQILYKHMVRLRKAEYAFNNRRHTRYWHLMKLLRIQTKYGINIPMNVVDLGFEIVHLGSVIINANARVGKYCKVHPGVCIGANHDKAPILGSHVYIGPGAKLFGDIVLADDIQVGANSVVNMSCDIKGAVLAGVPARVVRQSN